ncbi:hypothetical protein QEG98_18565 [Myxococcus sp. MxC21-1]|uniref:hypothetical protein n=1 Tax=Myxococcus sp. MxC21-1 TaxID=3041439 RepID=UPI00292EEBA7|nr:hypothetical protein [Myxococcus sp. MxC21-1]WNZ65449.1 hypothetical protein QEG98_18565 [Myxococcus sp. MxC21-1]
MEHAGSGRVRTDRRVAAGVARGGGQGFGGLRQADSTLLRAYLLGARVALKLKDTAAARSLLDDAVALNPDHQAAARLIAQIDADAASP